MASLDENSTTITALQQHPVYPSLINIFHPEQPTSGLFLSRTRERGGGIKSEYKKYHRSSWIHVIAAMYPSCLIHLYIYNYSLIPRITPLETPLLYLIILIMGSSSSTPSTPTTFLPSLFTQPKRTIPPPPPITRLFNSPSALLHLCRHILASPQFLLHLQNALALTPTSPLQGQQPTHNTIPSLTCLPPLISSRMPPPTQEAVLHHGLLSGCGSA